MSEMELLQENSERRACERISLGRRVRVELENGLILHGSTRDVSLGGLLFQSDLVINGFPPGEIAKLFLLNDKGESAPFPCEAVRISTKYAGLKIDRKFAAKFGMELAKGHLFRC